MDGRPRKVANATTRLLIGMWSADSGSAAVEWLRENASGAADTAAATTVGLERVDPS